MNSSKSSISISTLAVLFLVVGGVFVFGYEARVLQSTPTITFPKNVSIVTSQPNKILGGISTSTWQIYSNPELGYRIQYPADVKEVDDGDASALTLDFPKTYFSTIMKDDVTVSIYAAPTCEPVAVSGDPNSEIAENLMIHGINFLRNVQDDVAAGNRYHTVTYDTLRNDVCYRVTYFNHGANGAGLYESDLAKADAIQKTHDSELEHVNTIFNTMLTTFTFIDTPPGESEVTHTMNEVQTSPATTSPTLFFRMHQAQ